MNDKHPDDTAFDDLPPRNDPAAFLGKTDETAEAAEGGPRPDKADGIGDPVTTPGPMDHDPMTLLREAIADGSAKIVGLGFNPGSDCGHTPAEHAAMFDMLRGAAIPGRQEDATAPDISVPGARVRTMPLPKVKTANSPFTSSEMSTGFVLVVDNAADADDPDVQTNWLGIANAIGATTLILSEDEIDLGGGLADIADLARAIAGRGKR